MERTISGITYELTYKRVKNINLRVGADLSVAVSAPKRAGVREIDAFVAGRADWIQKARGRVAARAEKARPDCDVSDEACLSFFEKISASVYPLFMDAIKERPTLKVRLMKTRWGVCHYTKNTIVLNKRLYYMPLPAVEYVIAHEYAHFLHHDHQAGFHALMRALMPDYKERRRLLR